MSWHTKFRPRAVAQLHLTEVRETLLSLMKSGSFPQVFLCAGPKGTGKTSTSRIIGAMLNDAQNEQAVQALFFSKDDSEKKSKQTLVEPATDTPLANKIFNGQSYIVQEMDAASNRGIDDVRQLKERVALPPQEGLMSVYILDEVHMLTKEAFNALLKLLEEPPAHAVFILATTELHKVPDTIQSRCAVLPFRKANAEELLTALDKVVTAEKIDISKDALQAIVARADGSFRDGIKHLEMVVTASKSGEAISVETVESILQTGFTEYLPKILAAVVAKEEKTVVTYFKELRDLGVVSSVLYAALLTYLHQQLMVAVQEGDAKAVFSQRISHFLLNELQTIETVTAEPIPLLSIELKLLDIIYRAQDRSGGSSNSSGSKGSSSANSSTSAANSGGKSGNKGQAAAQKTAYDEYEAFNAAPMYDPAEEYSAPQESEHYSESRPNNIGLRAEKLVLPTIKVSNKPKIEIKDPIELHQNVTDPGTHVDTKPLLAAWSEFIEAVEVTNSSLGAVLRSSKPLPEKSNGVAKIEVYYQFHREQLMQPKFMDVLKKCAKPFIGGTASFEFIMGTASIPVVASKNTAVERVLAENAQNANHSDHSNVPAKPEETNLAAIADSILM